jgi:hypothetical protein
MKIGEEYKLYGEDGSCIATTQESPHKKLSKENCDKVFGVINIIDLAKRNSKHSEEDYIEGFNKAMELNKDKLFTVEDMISAYHQGANDGASYESACGDHDSYEQMKEAKKESEDDYIYFIESLQQPTEIEVDIKMEPCYYDQSLGAFSTSYTEDKPKEQPKLDKNGCLILKKK